MACLSWHVNAYSTHKNHNYENRIPLDLNMHYSFTIGFDKTRTAFRFIQFCFRIINEINVYIKVQMHDIYMQNKKTGFTCYSSSVCMSLFYYAHKVCTVHAYIHISISDPFTDKFHYSNIIQPLSSFRYFS